MRTRSRKSPAWAPAVAALLAMAPLLLPGDPQSHPGHGTGAAETAVFAAATHGGQAAHWEAAGAVRLSRCGTCLAPGPSFAPARILDHGRPRPLADRRAAAAIDAPADPGAGSSQRPRAPPPSARS